MRVKKGEERRRGEDNLFWYEERKDGNTLKKNHFLKTRVNKKKNVKVKSDEKTNALKWKKKYLDIKNKRKKNSKTKQ